MKQYFLKYSDVVTEAKTKVINSLEDDLVYDIQNKKWSDVVTWFRKYPELRTEENWQRVINGMDNEHEIYFKLAQIIIDCPEYQTEEKFEYFMTLEPSFIAIAMLMSDVPIFQTKEKFLRFISLPDIDRNDVLRVMRWCEKLHTTEIYEEIYKLFPSKKDSGFIWSWIKGYKKWYIRNLVNNRPSGKPTGIPKPRPNNNN